MDTKKTLKKIMAEPLRHARWLNSLSYLEYRGFRKIARSQSTAVMNMDLLQHMMEEVRHSLFFKRQAIKIGGSEFHLYDEQTLLCASALKSYFFHLDKEIALSLVQNNCQKLAKAAYCLVTWTVELRAMSIYQDYNVLLKEQGFDFSLSGILNEEAHHLSDMISESEIILKKNQLDPEYFKNLEEKHFRTLWLSLKESVEKEDSTENWTEALV